MASLTRAGSFRTTRARYRRAMSVEGTMGGNLAYTAATGGSPGSDGGPPILFKAQTSVGGQNTITSPAINTAASNLFVACVAIDQKGTPIGVKDSRSNLWLAGTQYAQPNGVAIRMFYCIDPIIGPMHTFTWEGVNTFAGMTVMAFRFNGQFATFDVRDVTPVENGVASNVDTISFQPGSVTPTSPDNLMITFAGWDTNVVTPSVDQGFANMLHLNFSATNRGIATLWQIGRSGPTNPVWSALNNSWKNHAAYIVSFRRT